MPYAYNKAKLFRTRSFLFFDRIKFNQFLHYLPFWPLAERIAKQE